MTRYYSLILAAAGGLLLACGQPQNAQLTVVQQADSLTTGESRTYQDGDARIRVQYESESALSVTRTTETGSRHVRINGVFQPDGILGCDSCLLVVDKATRRQLGGYVVNDSLFLLTVAGTNWRALLYGINFRTQTVLTTDTQSRTDHLQTYLPAFLFWPGKQQLLTSDRIEEPETSAQPYKTVLHMYGTDHGFFKHQHQTSRSFPSATQGDPDALLRTLY